MVCLLVLTIALANGGCCVSKAIDTSYIRCSYKMPLGESCYPLPTWKTKIHQQKHKKIFKLMDGSFGHQFSCRCFGTSPTRHATPRWFVLYHPPWEAVASGKQRDSDLSLAENRIKDYTLWINCWGIDVSIAEVRFLENNHTIAPFLGGSSHVRSLLSNGSLPGSPVLGKSPPKKQLLISSIPQIELARSLKITFPNILEA